MSEDVYFNGIRNNYLDHLYRRNIWSNFQTEKEMFLAGKILEVDGVGRLKVLLEDNRVRTFAFREIKYLI